MRSRRSAHDHVTEVARRRLEQLSAELAELRPDTDSAPAPHTRPEPSRETSPEPPEADAPATSLRPGPAPGRHAQRSLGRLASAAGWTGDRLPAALQGRVRLGTGHLLLVSLLLVAAFGLTGWWLRSGGSAESLPALATPPSQLVPAARSPTGQPSAGGATRAPQAPAATSAGPGISGGRIVVDVAGKVRRPGIATLPPGSRVVDALEAAGGPRRGVPLGSLNLARVLTDGEQILVGLPAPPGVAASAASAPTSGGTGATPMVNINSASQTELEALPDVGPVTAQAIMQFRAEHGAFTSVDELLEVSGIGEATLATIAPFVTL